MRQDVEEALAEWRDAVRRRDSATDGHRAELDAEVARYEQAFQELSSQYMMDRIDALKEAEQRRASAAPSTQSYHQAARDEVKIAAEIWDSAMVADQDVPPGDR